MKYCNFVNFKTDFLYGRTFFVDIDGAHSQTVCIDRGCLQCSVLGPILFSLYVRKAMQKLPQRVKYFSYADDSYVVVHEKEVKSTMEVFERVITQHIEELTSIGMIVNRSKTEIVNFNNPHSRDDPILVLKVDGCEVETMDKMKVLGVIFDNSLSWRAHVDSLKKKIAKVNGGIKLIRRKLNFKQTLVIVTAQVLSILYYASAVWLTPHIAKAELKRIESMHYRCVPITIRDFRQRVNKRVIDKVTRRLPPSLWAKYAGGGLMMNLKMQGKPINLLNSMSQNLYTKGRKEGRLYGYDNSKMNQGKQMTRNWIGQVLGTVDESWTNRIMNKDQIRIIMKKYLYPKEWGEV